MVDAIILLFPPTSTASVVKNALGVAQATLHIHHILPLQDKIKDLSVIKDGRMSLKGAG